MNTTKFTKIKALTDNSSAVGWLYKSSFNPKTHSLHDNVARKLARILLDTESCISSQHTPGKNNIIADSLSRDFHIEDKQLTFILKSIYPSQVNQNFRIYPLPKEIISWVSSLRAISTKLSGPPSRPERSKTGIFFAGADSWSAVVSRINSLKNTAGTHASSCYPHLQPVLDEMSLATQRKPDFVVQQYAPPSATYVRPFGRTYGATRL